MFDSMLLLILSIIYIQIVILQSIVRVGESHKEWRDDPNFTNISSQLGQSYTNVVSQQCEEKKLSNTK